LPGSTNGIGTTVAESGGNILFIRGMSLGSTSEPRETGGYSITWKRSGAYTGMVIKRDPGQGCDAIDGFNRNHAVLGTSSHCIATHPSDVAVALTALDATVHLRGPGGTLRVITQFEVPTQQSQLINLNGTGGQDIWWQPVVESGLTEDRFPVRGRGVQLVDPGLLASGTPTPTPNSAPAATPAST
jgi:hypothetical protein